MASCGRCGRALDREISGKGRLMVVLCSPCLRAAKQLEERGDMAERWAEMLKRYRSDPLNPYRY